MSLRALFRPLLALVASLSLLAAQPPATRQPCDATTYQTLLQRYDYDAAAPLRAEVVATRNEVGTQVDEIRFAGADGEQVPGYLFIPPGQGPHPVAVALHGLGGSKEDFVRLAPLLGMFGVDFAILALDARYHGARKQPGVEMIGPDLGRSAEAFRQTVVDYRRALDYLQTRREIDSTRMGLAGFSLGAMMGTVLTAIEPRLKTAVLVVGGADWITIATESPVAQPLRDALPGFAWNQSGAIFDAVDPLHFAPRLGTRPILMLNARRDEVIPQHAAETLHAAATGQPLVIEWYDSGHLLPPELAGIRILQWLQKNL
ncbi:MAG: dienelactone hydrolase family protein [Armatimonadetes bacterium]|nr:dienelactone hydrolase family protein [Armatimonadota bacterium]